MLKRARRPNHLLRLVLSSFSAVTTLNSMSISIKFPIIIEKMAIPNRITNEPMILSMSLYGRKSP